MDFKKPVTLSQIFISFLTGFGAGIAGTAVLAIIIFLSWSVIGGVLSPQEVPLNEFGVQIDAPQTHPLFLHFVVLAVFLGSMVAICGGGGGWKRWLCGGTGGGGS